MYERPTTGPTRRCTGCSENVAPSKQTACAKRERWYRGDDAFAESRISEAPVTRRETSSQISLRPVQLFPSKVYARACSRKIAHQCSCPSPSFQHVANWRNEPCRLRTTARLANFPCQGMQKEGFATASRFLTSADYFPPLLGHFPVRAHGVYKYTRTHTRAGNAT